MVIDDGLDAFDGSENDDVMVAVIVADCGAAPDDDWLYCEVIVAVMVPDTGDGPDTDWLYSEVMVAVIEDVTGDITGEV